VIAAACVLGILGGQGIEKSIQIISFLVHTHMFAFVVGG
jgi:hypothetical protein